MNKGMGIAALIGIYAALILDVFSSTNSSPQTTELFAADRAASLWRWVRIGALVSVAFIGLGVFMEYRDEDTDKSSWMGPLIGGASALAVMMLMYSHALKQGGGKIPGKTAMGYGGDY